MDHLTLHSAIYERFSERYNPLQNPAYSHIACVSEKTARCVVCHDPTKEIRTDTTF